MTPWTLEYAPTEKQQVLHSVKATQILYGGAAGGGKSHAMRMDAIMACLQNPGCKAYIFRRTLPEADDNHVMPLKMMMIPEEIATFSETKKTLQFANGSQIRIAFSEDDATIHKFQGAEIHWLGVDEAALMTPYQLRFLISRVRLGGWKPSQDGYFPRIVFTSNPGGPSHSYLKRKFIDSAPPMTYFYDKSTASKDNPRGWKSIFVPARMTDNPHLDAAMYSGAFTGMAPEQARALRDGDWDSVVGAALFNLSRDVHMLRAFTPPRHWTHFSAIDWGTYKPFSIGWYAVSEGATLEAKDGWPTRYIPPGALVRFSEWYGWNGEPDTGCRLESPQVARTWLEREEEMGLPPMDFRVGDSQMWAQMDGPSVVERMREATQGRILLRQGRRDRRANYAEVIARLGVAQHDNGETAPLFFATQNCEHFWRTAPGLLLDANEPDKGPATRNQEDHCYDEICFGMSMRPIITTMAQRREMEYDEFAARHNVRKGYDPYAT
jgi:hypothetical protein